MRILVIEDDRVDQLLLRRVLRAHDLTVAETMRDALLALMKGSFDLAITDLSLPDSLGLQSIENLERAAREMPIVIMTGARPPETKWPSIEKGTDTWMADLSAAIEGG